MRTERNEFDGRMPLVAYAGKKALVCVNEEEVVYPKTEYSEERTAYAYDTLWVDVDSQREDTVIRSLREVLSESIGAYDKSDKVNVFVLDGKRLWLSKEMRVGLANSISIEKAAKKSDTVLWFDGVCYTIPVDTALQMLSALELYALECYNVTQKHLAEIGKITSIEQLVSYDYTLGYPEHLVFSI